MRLATVTFVRPAIVIALLAASTTVAFAEDAKPVAEPAAKKSVAPPSEPLWEAEVQLGYGISQRSSEEMAETAIGPMTFAGIVAVAVNHEPSIFAFGGIVGEALQRSAIGATGGARLNVPGLPVRFSGGGVWMVAPKTLWGATASAGACMGKGKLGLCGDVQLTAYFAGTALPKDELEMQISLVLAVVARGGM